MFYFVSPTQVAAKTAVPKTPPSINTSCDKKQRHVWKPPAPGTHRRSHTCHGDAQLSRTTAKLWAVVISHGLANVRHFKKRKYKV